jgi:hypothetical protein
MTWIWIDGKRFNVKLPMGGSYCHECGTHTPDGFEHACKSILLQFLARRTAALSQIFLATDPNRKPNSFDTVDLMRAECRRLVLESGVPMDGLDDERRDEEVTANRSAAAHELARTKRELEVLYERIGALCRALGDAPDDPAHQDMTQLELRTRELLVRTDAPRTIYRQIKLYLEDRQARAKRSGGAIAADEIGLILSDISSGALKQW